MNSELEYFNFAKSIVARYCSLKGIIYTEDLEGEGLVGLAKAINSYDASLNPSFKSWASFMIRCEIKAYLKRVFGGKKGELKRQAQHVLWDDERYKCLSCNVEDMVYNKEILLIFFKFIPKKWQNVLILYYWNDYSFREIGMVNGYTKANACLVHMQSLKRIREYAINIFEEER